MEKERYETPKMEVIAFDHEDIITTSDLEPNELPIIRSNK